jgi:hypothetical protein
MLFGLYVYVETTRNLITFIFFVKVNEAFTRLYSSGRDRRVYVTDLTDTTRSVCVCQEAEPVVRVKKEVLYLKDNRTMNDVV